jgi:hypothetical protein
MHRFGHATTVADSVRDTFLPLGLQQQGLYQYHQQSLEEQERNRWQQQETLSTSTPPVATYDPLPNPTDQISMNATDDEETITTLSQETMLKIAELRRLAYRYRIFSNPDVVIKCVTHFAINGDNSFLDEKLEQLRGIDAISKY